MSLICIMFVNSAVILVLLHIGSKQYLPVGLNYWYILWQKITDSLYLFKLKHITCISSYLKSAMIHSRPTT